MLFYKTIKFLKENKSVIVITLLLLFLFLPIKSLHSAGESLTINIIPALDTTAYIDTNPIPIINGTSGPIGLSEGLHTIVFEDVSGYITPAPPEGRKVYISIGESKVMNATYFKPSDLKAIDRYTAEVLHFTPSERVVSPQWALTRGVASISADKTHWQYSAAELLVIGALPPELIITKTLPNYGSIIPMGGSDIDTEYEITFQPVGGTTLPNPYSAILTDKITIECPAEAPDCEDSVWIMDNPVLIDALDRTSYPLFVNTGKEITITMNNLVPSLEYKLKIKLHIEGDEEDGDGIDRVPSNTKIINNVKLDVGVTTKDLDPPYVNIIAGAFLQETVGGGVYAEGRIKLRSPSEVLYIIGAEGGVEEAKSETDWVIEQYGVRSGSATAFDLTGCPPYSGCGIMRENIDKAIKEASLAGTSIINTDIDLNPYVAPIGVVPEEKNIPEGGITYYENGLTIGSIGGAAISIKDRGTIIVNGDLNINVDLEYADSSINNILGIIVLNGNVNIAPGVKNLVGIYYIYADQGVLEKGSFKVRSKAPEYDDQFTLFGLVIASGYYSAGERKDAFILSRNYIGDLEQIDPYDPSTWEASEVFEYDSRVATNPPPGFSSQIFRVRD